MTHTLDPAPQIDRTETTPPGPALFHEFATLFPMMPIGEALDALREDIRVNGVLEPIVFLDGKILDGRHRYTLARELLIEYPRVEYHGDDPLGFVIAKNLHRRQLTDKQRSDIAARLAKMPRGRPSAENPPTGGFISTEQAAAALNVPVRAVERAKVIRSEGSPELQASYDAGDVSQSVAAEVAKLPPAEQVAAVAAGPVAVRAAAKKPRKPKEPSFTGVDPGRLRTARKIYARGAGGDLIGTIALAIQDECEACAALAEQMGAAEVAAEIRKRG